MTSALLDDKFDGSMSYFMTLYIKRNGLSQEDKELLREIIQK